MSDEHELVGEAKIEMSLVKIAIPVVVRVVPCAIDLAPGTIDLYRIPGMGITGIAGFLVFDACCGKELGIGTFVGLTGS